MTHPILREIEAFLATNKMAESTFGRLAVSDWKFIKELRGDNSRPPRRLWPETEQKVRHFIKTYRPDTEQDAAA